MTPGMPARKSSPAERWLLDLVRSIYLDRQTGLVELEAEGSDKHLYFVSGELYLLASAPPTRKIAKLLKMQAWGDQSSRQTLARLYARIAERFSSWHAYSFNFTKGLEAPSQELVGPLPTAQILMSAASEESALQRLKLRLGATGVRIVAAKPTARWAVSAIEREEAALLAGLDEPVTLEELLTERGDSHLNAIGAIARLWAVGLIREASEATVRGERGEGGSPEGRSAPPEPAGGREAGRGEIYQIWRRHFGLTGDPFSLTPDPSFLFISEGHGEALAGLKLGLLERRGLLAMTGEVGTGKTTLLYALLSSLDPEIEAAYIYNTALSTEEILQSALIDFGVAATGSSRLDLLVALNDFLARLADDDRTAALVIDEAQNLSDDTVEQLRLLLNFETFDRKLLQIVLVGQPELARRLRAPRLRQIANRVAVRCHLDPLSREESRRYVLHRLEAAGASSEVFSRQALRLVVRKARGIPRRINVICHNAMLFAYAAGERRVGRTFVREALRETRVSALEALRRGPGLQEGSSSTARGLLARLPRVLGFPKFVWLGVLGLASLSGLGLSLGGSPATRPAPGEGSTGVAYTTPAIPELPPGKSSQPGGWQDSLPNSHQLRGEPVPQAQDDTSRPRAAAPEPRIGETTVHLRLRSAPSLEAPVAMVLPPETELVILEAEEDWLQVRARDSGRDGWVSRVYVAEGQGKSPDGLRQS